MIRNQMKLIQDAPIKNMIPHKVKNGGYSHGLTECGYDLRLKKGVWMFPGRRFVLGSSLEEFQMPEHLMGRVLNKSTRARRGVDASMTTNIEPGWNGFLTIELSYRKLWPIYIPAGVGICQVIFEIVETPAKYAGKYQDQPDKPVPAIYSPETV